MLAEQKKDLKIAIRLLRTVSEGDPDITIGHCKLFEVLGNTCAKCPFIEKHYDNPTLCDLRESIKYLEGLPEKGESLYK